MKPILFNTQMVRAILEGRKSVTRRVVKPQPPATSHVSKVKNDYGWSFWEDNPEKHYMKPPYKTGDVLWVRETWAKDPFRNGYIYPTEVPGAGQKWKPSIHMPREAARIFLRVTGVRVERLQEIDDAGVVSEGLEIGCYFDELWNRTIKPKDRPTYGWDTNPWVWVIEFERINKEEEAVWTMKSC